MYTFRILPVCPVPTQSFSTAFGFFRLPTWTRKTRPVCDDCHGSGRSDPEKEPELTITHIGEPDFILTYKKTGASHQLFHIVKTAFVCLISFFGAAFSIMTFNTDADVGKLFRQIYEQVTGSVSNGFTILEITYSVGLGLGVLFFFNHFSRVKITSDPSPMQVQMRIYEDQVNSTVIEDINRKQAAEHQEPS